MEDGHADALELGAVADRAVDDDPGDAPLACGERDDVAAMGGPRLAADREHDHVARLGLRDGVMEREVVAGRALNGERRPERVSRRPRRLEAEQDRDAVAAGRGEQRAADGHAVAPARAAAVRCQAP